MVLTCRNRIYRNRDIGVPNLPCPGVKFILRELANMSFLVSFASRDARGVFNTLVCGWQFCDPSLCGVVPHAVKKSIEGCELRLVLRVTSFHRRQRVDALRFRFSSSSHLWLWASQHFPATFMLLKLPVTRYTLDRACSPAPLDLPIRICHGHLQPLPIPQPSQNVTTFREAYQAGSYTTTPAVPHEPSAFTIFLPFCHLLETEPRRI